MTTTFTQTSPFATNPFTTPAFGCVPQTFAWNTRQATGTGQTPIAGTPWGTMTNPNFFTPQIPFNQNFIPQNVFGTFNTPFAQTNALPGFGCTPGFTGFPVPGVFNTPGFLPLAWNAGGFNTPFFGGVPAQTVPSFALACNIGTPGSGGTFASIPNPGSTFFAGLPVWNNALTTSYNNSGIGTTPWNGNVVPQPFNVDALGSGGTFNPIAPLGNMGGLNIPQGNIFSQVSPFAIPGFNPLLNQVSPFAIPGFNVPGFNLPTAITPFNVPGFSGGIPTFGFQPNFTVPFNTQGVVNGGFPTNGIPTNGINQNAGVAQNVPGNVGINREAA